MNDGHVMTARVSEPGHPLQGEPVVIRWPADGVDTAVTVHVRVGLTWVPVQFMDEHIASLGDGPEAS